MLKGVQALENRVNSIDTNNVNDLFSNNTFSHNVLKIKNDPIRSSIKAKTTCNSPDIMEMKKSVKKQPPSRNSS